MLLDCYGPMSYYHAAPKVGHLPSVRCASSSAPQTPPPSHLHPLVKAHTKLPILAAYSYCATGTEMTDCCEIRICG